MYEVYDDDFQLHGKLITYLTKRCVNRSGATTVDELHFFYNVQSRPAKVSYNSVLYTYVHNLQGGIMASLTAAEPS